MKNVFKRITLSASLVSASLGCLLSYTSASPVKTGQEEDLKGLQRSDCAVPLNLAQFPEEILSHIAAYVAEGNADQAGRDVGNFALASSRFHPIGEEVLQNVILHEPQALVTVLEDKKAAPISVLSPAKVTHDVRQALFALAQNKIKSKKKLRKLGDLCAEMRHPAEMLFRALGAQNIEAYKQYKEDFNTVLKAGIVDNEPRTLELGMILHGMNASFTFASDSWFSKEVETWNFPLNTGMVFAYSIALRGAGYSKAFAMLMPHLSVRDCILLGHRYDGSNLLDTAQRLFEMARQPNNLPADRACILNELGNIQVKLGHYEQAKRLFNQALAEDKNIISHSNLSEVYLHEGNALKAAEHQLLAFAPHNAETDYKLGLLYEKQGRIMAAAQLYRRAVKAGIAGAKAALDKVTSPDAS